MEGRNRRRVELRIDKSMFACETLTHIYFDRGNLNQGLKSLGGRRMLSMRENRCSEPFICKKWDRGLLDKPRS